MRHVSNWIFPRRALWRLLLLLAVANLFVGPVLWAYRPRTSRVTEEAGLLNRREVRALNRLLAAIHEESGVDIRFLIVPDVPGGDLERFALERARAMGVGRDVDRRGMLFVYDLGAQRLRIEVGPTLEGIFPDGFLGYLMRDHTRVFFAALETDRENDYWNVSNPELGLRLTMYMLQHRLREAALGMEYDPRPVAYIRDSVRLAAGGGATSAVPLGDGSHAFVHSRSTKEAQQHFAPQPTVEGTHARYLEWLRDGANQIELPLFTSASRDLLHETPMTPAYIHYILMGYYGQPYVVDVRGDLAMLVYTGTPLQSPQFFRRTSDGWQMDIWAEVTNTRNLIGGAYTWSLYDSGDGFAETFADTLAVVGNARRHSAADNRSLPTRARPYPAGRISLILVAWAMVLFARGRRQPR